MKLRQTRSSSTRSSERLFLQSRARKNALLALLTLCAASSPWCFAQQSQAPDEEHLREGAIRQQQIQGESQKLLAQWDAMIGEYERNGLSSEELNALKKLRAAIAKLSDSDMRKVIELLQNA